MENALQVIMLRYGLTRREVAGLLGKPLNAAKGYSNSTVDNWLSGKAPAPGMALELLRLKLKGRKPVRDPWQQLLRQPQPYTNQRVLETDLACVLNDLKQGRMPGPGRLRAQPPLRRAGYLLDLATHFGGPALMDMRDSMQHRARLLQQRLSRNPDPITFRAGDRPREWLMDDLAKRWGLAAGMDLRRFRQLAQGGHA